MDDFFRSMIQRLTVFAADRGEITFSELNDLLPSTEVTPKQIETIMDVLREMGIHLIEDRSP